MTPPRLLKRETPRPCPRCYAPMTRQASGWACMVHGAPAPPRPVAPPPPVKPHGPRQTAVILCKGNRATAIRYGALEPWTCSACGRKVKVIA